MNQQQRRFLIDKITEKSKLKRRVLEESKKDLPSASNYVFKALLDGTLKIKSQQEIFEALKRKALAAKEGDDWLGKSSYAFSRSTGDREVTLKLDDLCEVPSDYEVAVNEVKEHNAKLREEIDQISIQLETLEIRIQLASDKTLQKMVSEVDDMGEISLIDTKLKLLS